MIKYAVYRSLYNQMQTQNCSCYLLHAYVIRRTFIINSIIIITISIQYKR